jgi:signal peptidase I
MALLVGLLLLLFYLATEFLARPCLVAGNSMEPGLRPGDRVVVDLWTYRQRDPRPGEVVLFTGAAGEEIIKRVVSPGALGSARPPSAAADGVWVLGDNADSSADSRRFGPVQRARVRGRAVWLYWPPSRAGRLPAPSPDPATER